MYACHTESIILSSQFPVSKKVNPLVSGLNIGVQILVEVNLF